MNGYVDMIDINMDDGVRVLEEKSDVYRFGGSEWQCSFPLK